MKSVCCVLLSVCLIYIPAVLNAENYVYADSAALTANTENQEPVKVKDDIDKYALGTDISDPKVLGGNFLLLSAVSEILPYFEVESSGVNYTVAVSGDGIVEYIGVSRPNTDFKTPEGISLEMTCQEVFDAYPEGSLVKIPGWASIIMLPSGWNCAFDWDIPLSKDSSISFFYQASGKKYSNIDDIEIRNETGHSIVIRTEDAFYTFDDEGNSVENHIVLLGPGDVYMGGIDGVMTQDGTTYKISDASVPFMRPIAVTVTQDEDGKYLFSKNIMGSIKNILIDSVKIVINLFSSPERRLGLSGIFPRKAEGQPASRWWDEVDAKYPDPSLWDEQV